VTANGTNALDALIEGRRLIVCVGPGGVGKTTTAAAIAARAARAGRRAFVLTIDPAKRLADALGIGELVDETRAVPEAMLRAAGIAGSLSAAMLDTKQGFDAMIRRVSRDEATVRRLLDNRIYHAIGRTLARTHAYVAVERLYEAAQHGGFDLVVLDTPPMRSALDVLDAPSKFVRFFDDRIMRWFVPAPGSRGNTTVVKLLGLATGQSTAEEIALFFSAMAAIRGELNKRLDQAQALLRAPTAAFVLVTAPEQVCLDDAAFMRDGLAARGVHLDAVVFNRAFVPEPGQRRRLVEPGASAPELRGLASAEPGYAELAARLHAIRRAEAAINTRATATIDAFARKLPPNTSRVVVPRVEADIRDLPGLLALLDEPALS
jgi:anion-transporting  ArsA/GET3 family ATPase